jgi:casein kinase 1
MPFYRESLENIHHSAIQPTKLLHSPSIWRSQNSKKMAANIMCSAINILAHIHDKYVVHRDIKPANFMIHNNELVLIDFGLASFYVDRNEKHISFADPKKRHIIGTPKYASWNIHCGEEYSRRDDLMSIVYIGAYLLYGNKLWESVSGEYGFSYETPVGSPAIEQSDISHPRNTWFKTQKELANILKIVVEWEELHQFTKQVYTLSFQERPSYKQYVELFSKTI